MSAKPSIDLAAAHRYFSAECFNKTWEYIDKPDRSPEDDLAMLHTSLASLWHWTQRPDQTAQNLSVGYWQVSRVYALLGQAENSRRYAELSLQASQVAGVPPFYLAYAHEALARAAMIAGDVQAVRSHLNEARALSERMSDEEAKKMLLDDLGTIG